MMSSFDTYVYQIVENGYDISVSMQHILYKNGHHLHTFVPQSLEKPFIIRSKDFCQL